MEPTQEQLLQRLEYLHDRVALLERQFRCLQRVAASLGSTLNLDEILHTIAEQVTTMLDAERATIFMVDDETRDLTARVIIGNDLKEIRLRPGQGIAGWVAMSGKTLNVKDAYKDKRFDPEFDRVSGFQTRSILCQPMATYGGKVIGVVQVLNKSTGYFTVDDEHMLATITTQATISLDNSKYYMQLHEANLRLREAQENLRRNYERLETLYAIQLEMTQTWEKDAVVKGVLGQLLKAIPCQAAALLLTEPAPPVVHFVRLGAPGQVISPAAVGGILGNVVKGGNAGPEGLTCLHPQLAVEVQGRVHEALLNGNGEVVGALALANRKGEAGFSGEDQQVLRIVARQLATALERVQQREELNRSNGLALIGQALSGVLHDLKSPMSIISGNVQLMEAEEDPEKRKAFAAAVLSQFRLVSTMTQEVLAFARGETQMLKRPIYLQKFVEEMRELLSREFAGRSITFSIDAAFLGKIKADEGKLKRLFFNIARNAMEAMPNGGSFHILLAEQDGKVVFRFSDTGPGIPLEIRDRVFQSFVTSGKKGGTGLGLAIVKKIVEQHGGEVTFATESGKGTTFTVTLPKE